ncbi:MAG TPA: S8 family peptidase [Sphingobium sp.]|uniref:S8 family peptidase n=1 Tax=Sphingobium sp. TaxID=1912891 RepID=UPI002ED572E3
MNIIRIRTAAAALTALATTLALTACGGGSSGVSSTPTPSPLPGGSSGSSQASGITPTPGVNYDTAEYRASTDLAQHGAITAYQAGASGAGVTVGVIDSGLSDPTGELTGRISSASRDFAGNSSIADSGGHGTEVSMVLAAARNDKATMGVAWGATILALRTDTPGSCDTSCTHSTTAIANALDYAVTNGAKVVNISLGGAAAPPYLLQAVQRATAAGTIIVIAGGNDAAAAPDALAGSIADPAVGHGLVIIAEALDRNNVRASFANAAKGYEMVTLGALGVYVPTVSKDGTVVNVSGSSFSTPEIAGAVALLAQAFPNLTSAQIVQLLLSSARDLGVAGADSIYGVGALDIAKAFSPTGSLSLAGSATALSLNTSGNLSSAMGDAAATSQSFHSVATDGLGRAYAVQLGGDLRAAVPAPNLAPALDTRMRSISSGVPGGPARIAMSIAPGLVGGADSHTLLLGSTEAQNARLIAARIATHIAPGAELALGFASGGEMLRGMTGDATDGAFLVARTTDLLTSDFRAERSMRLRWRVGPGIYALATGELGHVGHVDRDSVWTPRSAWRRDGLYTAMGMGAELVKGRFDTSLTASQVLESGTALGARFSPIMGAQSGRTILLDATLRFDAGNGWSLGGKWRRGWTHAAAGGALRDGGSITSEAWSVTAGRQGVLSVRDSLSLRLSRPLRVIASALNLVLPTSYDYASGEVVEGVQSLDLRPHGREQSVEAAYATPLGTGWLSANLFHRIQPGNIATLPAETGGAFRYNWTF